MGCGSSQSVAVLESSRLAQDKKILEPYLGKKIEIKEASKPVEISNQIEELNETKPNYTPRSQTKLPPLVQVKLNQYHSTTRFDSGVSNQTDTTAAPDSSDNISERRGSISSSDSGYLDNEYKNVITEKSDLNLVNEIEKQFVEKKNLDLLIVGKSCPPLLSAKEKENIQNKEEKISHELLKQTGLVQTAITVKDNSAQFEIIEEKLLNKKITLQRPESGSNSLGSGSFHGPQIRFLQREKTKTNLTIDQIDEKIEKANQRKLQQTQNKLRGSATIERKSVSFNHKIQLRQINGTEMSEEVIERQKKLRELRDKLQAKNAKETQLTPRSQQVASELENFKPKTPSAFKAEFE